MTEQEWLVSTDPAAMLASRCSWGNLNSVRKLQLFACGCCRQVWDGKSCPVCDGHPSMPDCGNCGGTGRVGGLTDPRSRRAVEVAERYADGEATEAELGHAWEEAADSRLRILWATTRVHIGTPSPGSLVSCGVPPATQAALLRDIFGNPFRPVKVGCSRGINECPTHAPDWLRWNDGTVPRIARRIYDEQRWQDMPILADALLDAGADDEAILSHCREPLHTRGCFVCDLILGKE